MTGLAPSRRRWFRYSLKTLFVLVTASCLFLAFPNLTYGLLILLFWLVFFCFGTLATYLMDVGPARMRRDR